MKRSAELPVVEQVTGQSIALVSFGGKQTQRASRHFGVLMANDKPSELLKQVRGGNCGIAPGSRAQTAECFILPMSSRK